MKLLATLATVALSSQLDCPAESTCWEGSEDHRGSDTHTFNPCGLQKHEGSGYTVSMVNSTCTWNGYNVRHVYAGNGAFITGENTFTGYDGISGDVNLVVFFDQQYVDGTLDNSSYPDPDGQCFNFDVDCVPNGEADTAKPYFMEVVNDGRQAPGTNFNLQIANAQSLSTLTVYLRDRLDRSWFATNITVPENFGEVVMTTGDSFTVNFNEDWGFHSPFGQLFQIFITDDSDKNDPEYPLDLWKSTVSE